MSLFERIMECDNNMISEKLDQSLRGRNAGLPILYRKKYGYGFHTSVALLHSGNMPGYSRKKACQIDAEIAELLGYGSNPSYFSKCVFRRVSDSFCIDFRQDSIDEAKKNKTQLIVNSIDINFTKEECIYCNEMFDVRDDGIHCACVSCAPNGFRYDMESHRSTAIYRTGRMAAI